MNNDSAMSDNSAVPSGNGSSGRVRVLAACAIWAPVSFHSQPWLRKTCARDSDTLQPHINLFVM
jgi:hypothetical protein